jgi:hypothetical protein
MTLATAAAAAWQLAVFGIRNRIKDRTELVVLCTPSVIASRNGPAR